MKVDHVEWRSAPPLWRSGLDGSTDIKRPEILRFKGDDFMEQLHAELSADKPDLTGYYAATETWRDNAVGLEAATASDLTMKLYQPAHERFYLAAGGLVCRKYGLPGKTVDTAAGEAAFFVLRRLEPKDPAVEVDPTVGSTYVESGWMPNGGQPGWQQVVTGTVPTNEERLPLSPYTYPNGAGSRTVLTGLVPAGAREKYEAGRTLPVPEPDPTDGMAALTDERLAQLDPVVTGLQALLGAPQLDSLAVSDEIREALFFSLLDLDDYLAYLGAGSAADRAAVEGVLAAAQFTAAPGGITWLKAVEQAAEGRAAIEEDTSQQPDEPVSDLDNGEIEQALVNIGVHDTSGGFPVGAFDTTFFNSVESALPALPTAVLPAPDVAPVEDGARGVYAIRFGYERPHCPPSHRLVLSQLSRPFELSSFFDPDAPVRNVRIDLSIDTSPAGLRKFAKGGVTIALSKQLRAQIERIQAVKLSDLEDGEIPDEKGLDLGMVCSLSIPIITICALILLMIIVSLLNIVFFWLPLFKICRPKV